LRRSSDADEGYRELTALQRQGARVRAWREGDGRELERVLPRARRADSAGARCTDSSAPARLLPAKLSLMSARSPKSNSSATAFMTVQIVPPAVPIVAQVMLAHGISIECWT
jgi:hypothetical protein